MRHGLIRFLIATAVVVAVSADGVAQDDNADEAIALFSQAIELYRNGDYAEAATIFETAYGYDPSPRIAYNAGRAFELDGQIELALEWYINALEGDDPALVELVEEAWQGIDAELGIVHVASFGRGDLSEEGTLYVVFDAPSEALLTLSTGVSMQAPARLGLPAGYYDILIEAEGYEDYTAHVRLGGGDVEIVRAQPRRVVAEVAPERAPLAWRRPVTYGLAGLGLAGLGGGVYFFTQAAAAVDERDALQGFDEVGFQMAQEDAQQSAALSTYAYAVGFVALGGAAALHFLAPADTEAEVAFSPSSVTLRVQF